MGNNYSWIKSKEYRYSNTNSTFIFSSYLDQTYSELNEILDSFVDKEKIDIDRLILAESINFQKMMIPSFIPGKVTRHFKSNVAYVLHKLVTENQKLKIDLVSNDVSIYNPTHDFDNIVEFNRRRVSGGYAIGLAKVDFDEKLVQDSQDQNKATNVNIKSGPTFAGNFISSENSNNWFK